MDGTPLALVNNGTVCYPHPDRLGTVQRITDAGQQVVWSARYEPFGQAVIASGIEYNPRFPGQYYDAETGLYYNHFRDYDAGVGRYVESDPIGLDGGINTYGYANGNPLYLIDPLGLMGQGSGAVGGTPWQGKNGEPEPICGDKCNCWLTCLYNDSFLPELLPGLVAPLAGLKTPGQIRPGASVWGSIDRRFRWLPFADPNWGPEVRRVGKMQRVKCIGRYGAAASAMAAFTVGYTIGTAGRCWVECN